MKSLLKFFGFNLSVSQKDIVQLGPKKLLKAYRDEDGVLCLEYNNGEIRKYKGSCTVWHTYPMMKRCTTTTEMLLCDIDEYLIEHGNPYPIAHEKAANGA